MSHADTILDLPGEFEVLANTENIPYAAFRKSGSEQACTVSSFTGSLSFYRRKENNPKFFGGYLPISSQDWTPAHFVNDTVAALDKQIGDRKSNHGGLERGRGFHGGCHTDPPGDRGTVCTGSLSTMAYCVR